MPVVRAVAHDRLRLVTRADNHYLGKQLTPEGLPGVRAVGYWDAQQDQDWGLPWHRDEGIEFTLLERGTLGFAVKDREYILQPDNLTVTLPWQKHRVGSPRVTRSRLDLLTVDVGARCPSQVWNWPPWLVLSKGDVEELTDILRHNEQAVWKAPATLRECFRAMSQAVESDHKGSSVSRLTVQINDFFLQLLEMLRKQNARFDRSPSGSRRGVELFLADLRAHPEHLDPECRLESMAASCGLGTTQFIYYVKRLTNMTPTQYVNHCRLEVAERLLHEKPKETITDVALACGFNSSQYFATLFRRHFGKSPHEIRASDGQVDTGRAKVRFSSREPCDVQARGATCVLRVQGAVGGIQRTRAASLKPRNGHGSLFGELHE